MKITRENHISNLKIVEKNARITKSNNSDYNGFKAKVCLIGERQVGKSSLVKKYVLDEFDDEYFATLGMKVYKKVVLAIPPRTNEAIPVTLMIWDIMGDNEYVESMKDIYIYGAAGMIAVGDVTKPSTVPPLGPWMGAATDILGDIPVQIILNKRDQGENEYARNVGLRIAKNHLAPCYLTSASRGDNVERAFDQLAYRILAQSYENRAPSENKVVEVLVESIGEKKTLEELSYDFGLTPAHVEPKLRQLVRSGHLTLESVDISSEGLPVMSYSGTGKLVQE